MKENCKNCICMTCDANNKLKSTDPLQSCYGCNGDDEECVKPMESKDCLYAFKKDKGV